MKLSRKHTSLKANSLLESVIALAIISIGIYAALLVFNQVFTNSTSEKFHIEQKNCNNLFYELQLGIDTIKNDESNYQFEINNLNSDLKEYKINYKDSAKIKLNNRFYILNE
jgi:type II secretory pathway pseudopilin PulG